MTQQELVEQMTDWLADYAKRVRQRKNDLPEAEAWSFKDHVLIPAGCVMLEPNQPITKIKYSDGSEIWDIHGCAVLPLAPEGKK